jgi:hypothetical protein
LGGTDSLGPAVLHELDANSPSPFKEHTTHVCMCADGQVAPVPDRREVRCGRTVAFPTLLGDLKPSHSLWVRPVEIISAAEATLDPRGDKGV